MRKCILIITLLLLPYGCAKHMPINYNQVDKNMLVQITTQSGDSFKGIVKAKQPAVLIVQTTRDENSLRQVAAGDIARMTSTPPVYDYQKNVISEWEIRDHQRSANTWLYSLGGAGLSFGASFFIGSLLHRGMSDNDARYEILWSTTAVGTTLGTWLFARAGKAKDRNVAITQIQDRRYEIAQKQIEIEKAKHNQIQSEIDKMKADHDKQEEELKRLKDRIKEREKSQEQGETKD